METTSPSPIANLLTLTVEQIEYRLDELDAEQRVLRHVLRGLHARDKVRRICTDRVRRERREARSD